MKVVPNPVHCDFCAATPVLKILDIADFDMGDGVRSVAGWGVCAPCFELVEKEDAVGLLNRARLSMEDNPDIEVAAKLLDPNGKIKDRHSGWVARVHKEFWNAYKLKRSLVEAKLSGNKPAPWIVAHDKKFQTLKYLEQLARAHEQNTRITIPKGSPMSVLEDILAGKSQLLYNFNYDTALQLRMAETYSFSGDAFEAIRRAAESIPHDSPLHTEQVPGIGAGWWVFDPWFPVKASEDGSQLAAVLWTCISDGHKTGWVSRSDLKEHGVGFTCFVNQQSNMSQPKTSLSWAWLFGENVHDVIARTTREYRKLYEQSTTAHLMEKEAMLLVASVCLFFLAAAVWIEQEIVETVEGKIPRQQRRQVEREYKLPTTPGNVKVIALRRKRRIAETPIENPDKKPREWHWQWEVEGHFRNQPYGPGHTQRKLVYIMPYMKGPDDRPLKPRSDKVFAVVR
jgi:hypothetical protein